MFEWVKALEGKTTTRKRDFLMAFLRENAIPFRVQAFARLGYRGANLIVSSGPAHPAVLVTAHYDSVPGSPGANDNASSVAVLMKLSQGIRSLPKELTVGIIFMDGEEARLRVGPFRWGCWGSQAYLREHSPEDVRAVYNLEWCGEGDFVALWPVDRGVKQTAAFKVLEKVLLDRGYPYDTATVSRLVVSSDHCSFRSRGIPGAFALSLLPREEVELLRRFFANRWEILKFFLRRQGGLKCSLLQRLHSSQDRSEFIREESLELAFDIMHQTLRVWCSSPSGPSA
ncbi:MAG: M28 family peptidase [Chloroflexi bacterium]|nr:M28 family peptidase [Chloroflexota bacterium]